MFHYSTYMMWLFPRIRTKDTHFNIKIEGSKDYNVRRVFDDLTTQFTSVLLYERNNLKLALNTKVSSGNSNLVLIVRK